VVKPVSGLKNILIKAAIFWSAVILTDFVLVSFFGPQFWSYAGYFFGSDIRTTLIILMFIEGAVIFTVGVVWASGLMETTFEGDNLMTNPYYQKEQWKQRREQTEGQNTTGKILMLVGGPLLITAFILVFV
jgi:type VI protein secretion system component VasK